MRPFRLSDEQPRDTNGRFRPQPQNPLTPPQVFEQSKTEQLLQVVARTRVAEHATPPNEPQAAEEFQPVRAITPNKPFRF